jgi:hypothetical protein
MMDRLDRMLGTLPADDPSPDLSARIRRSVRLRHRRRQVVRWTGASVLGLVGVWLLSPGIAWLSSGALYAPGTTWLAGSLDYLNSESLDMLSGFWNGASSAQNAIGSALAFSIWLGAFLLCCSIFLVIDSRVWQPLSGSRSHGGNSTRLASSVHI